MIRNFHRDPLRFQNPRRRRTSWLAVAALLIALFAALPAWGANSALPPPTPTKDYVKSYALVILLAGLGVLVVCRPGRRAAEPKKPESGIE